MKNLLGHIISDSAWVHVDSRPTHPGDPTADELFLDCVQEAFTQFVLPDREDFLWSCPEEFFLHSIVIPRGLYILQSDFSAKPLPQPHWASPVHAIPASITYPPAPHISLSPFHWLSVSPNRITCLDVIENRTMKVYHQILQHNMKWKCSEWQPVQKK